MNSLSDILYIHYHQKRNYKELEIDMEKPEFHVGRHQATPCLFVYSQGHSVLQDPINDHLTQLFIPSIPIMILMKKFLNSSFDD